jgi:hypothetical protein
MSTIAAAFFFFPRSIFNRTLSHKIPWRKRRKKLEIMKKMKTLKDFSWHKAAEYNLFEENYQ